MRKRIVQKVYPPESIKEAEGKNYKLVWSILNPCKTNKPKP